MISLATELFDKRTLQWTLRTEQTLSNAFDFKVKSSKVYDMNLIIARALARCVHYILCWAGTRERARKTAGSWRFSIPLPVRRMWFGWSGRVGYPNGWLVGLIRLSTFEICTSLFAFRLEVGSNPWTGRQTGWGWKAALVAGQCWSI